MIGAIFLYISAFIFKKNKLGRIEGLMLILLEAGYMTWLFMN